MSRLYVYAFSRSPIRPFSLHGRRIHSVDVSGIQVVADRAVPADGVTEATLRRQHAIVEAVAARTDALLPARAGSVVEMDELRARIAARRAEIDAALDLVSGREQMTLRAAGPAGTPPQPPADLPSSGTAYLEGRRAAAALPASLDAARAAVSALVDAERVRTGRGALPAAVFHLIARGRAAEYRARLDAHPALTGEPPVVSGPWPPFAFTPELAG